MSKRILITGANGFVGKNLKKFLSPHFDVTACGRKELDLLKREDVASFLKKGKFDVVIHTATYDAAPEFSRNNPDKVLEYNLRMFDNVAQCDSYYGMMIYFGSGAEWRREKLYGLSKYFMDQVAQNKNNIHNLRLYSVYGVGTDWRYRFINNACAKAALGMPITIPPIGKCDYLHVIDLCQIVRYYIDNPKKISKSEDICSGDVLSSTEIVEHIREAAFVSDIILHNVVSPTVSRAKSCREAYFGNSDFVNSLPFVLTPLNDGIKELINFYEKNPPNREEFVY